MLLILLFSFSLFLPILYPFTFDICHPHVIHDVYVGARDNL